MIWGVFPEEFLPKFYREDSNPISWESHLGGGIVGFIFAILTRKYGPKRKVYSWETQLEPDAREKWLWEKYKESLPEDERLALEKKYGEEADTQSKDQGYWFTNDSR